MWTQRLMWIAWPAFLVAGLLEMLVFAMVDPSDLHWFGEPLGLSRQGVYTLAFFLFWAMTIASSALTPCSRFHLSRSIAVLCPMANDQTIAEKSTCAADFRLEPDTWQTLKCPLSHFFQLATSATCTRQTIAALFACCLRACHRSEASAYSPGL